MDHDLLNDLQGILLQEAPFKDRDAIHLLDVKNQNDMEVVCVLFGENLTHSLPVSELVRPTYHFSFWNILLASGMAFGMI